MIIITAFLFMAPLERKAKHQFSTSPLLFFFFCERHFILLVLRFLSPSLTNKIITAVSLLRHRRAAHERDGRGGGRKKQKVCHKPDINTRAMAAAAAVARRSLLCLLVASWLFPFFAATPSGSAAAAANIQTQDLNKSACFAFHRSRLCRFPLTT